MNTKRTVLTLTFAIFTLSSLYAGPCINCVATVLKEGNKTQISQTKWNTNRIIKTIDKKSSTQTYYAGNITNDSEEYIDGMLALDDNEDNSVIAQNESENQYNQEENDIVLTYDTPKIELAKTLYACEDIANNIVACDNEKKEECECV